MKVKNLISNLCLCFAVIFSAGCDSGSAGKNSTEHNRSPVPDDPPYQSTPSVLDVVPTIFAFAALYEDASVITWGHEEYGGDSLSVQNELKNVIGLFSTSYAFAALKQDGSVVTWGNPKYGGDSKFIQHELKDVVEIVSSRLGFAALRSDRSVVTWGFPYSPDLPAPIISNVKEIKASDTAFSAIRADSSIVTWAGFPIGNEAPIFEEQSSLASEVEQFVANGINGFAVRLSSGAVHSWGNIRDFSPDEVFGAIHIFDTGWGFLASFSNESTYYWGVKNHPDSGTNPPEFLSNVRDVVYSEKSDSVALLDSGDIVSWGAYGDKEIETFIPTWEQLNDFPKTLHNIEIVKGGSSAESIFVAVDEFGTAYSWGEVPNPQEPVNDVVDVVSTASAVAALKSDGSVVYWGEIEVEIDVNTLEPKVDLLLQDVERIYANNIAFSAVLADQTIVSWGQFVEDGVVATQRIRGVGEK